MEKRKRGQSKGEKVEKINTKSVEGGDDGNTETRSQRGQENQPPINRRIAEKRSALESRWLKLDRRAGNSESRRERYLKGIYRMGTKIDYDHDGGNKANKVSKAALIYLAPRTTRPTFFMMLVFLPTAP